MGTKDSLCFLNHNGKVDLPKHAADGDHAKCITNGIQSSTVLSKAPVLLTSGWSSTTN